MGKLTPLKRVTQTRGATPPNVGNYEINKKERLY